MYLLRTRPLIEQLGKGEINRKEKAFYLLASFLMFNVIYYAGLTQSTQLWSVASILEGLAVAGISVIGLVTAFDASGGDDSTDFVAEFTCLYVPITISTMLVVWTMFWLITIGFRESLIYMSDSRMQFAVNLSRMGTNLFGFLTFAAAVIVQGATFYRITRALAKVREMREQA